MRSLALLAVLVGPVSADNPPIIQVSPASLEFGIVHACDVGDICAPTCETQPLTQTLTVTNAAADPSELDYYFTPALPAATEYDDFIISGDCPDTNPCRLGAGESQTTTITFRPRSLTVYDALSVVSLYPGQTPIAIPFHAEGGRGLLAFDGPAALGATEPGQTVTTTVSVHDAGTSCVTFSMPMSSAPGIVLTGGPNPPTIELQAGDSYAFQLACTAPSYSTLEFDISWEASDFLLQDVWCTAFDHPSYPTAPTIAAPPADDDTTTMSPLPAAGGGGCSTLGRPPLLALAALLLLRRRNRRC